MVKKGDYRILIKIFVLTVSLFLMISQVSGEIPPHIDPGNVTQSDSNLKQRQAMIINELLSHWSGVFISLDKGDIKSAQDNFEQYLGILQQNDNILIEIEGDAYEELKESGNTLNLTMDQVKKLRSLYEEGKIAYQNIQTQKAIQITLESRGIIGDLNSYQKKFVMDAVEQFPGINITDYQVGSSEYDNVLKNLRNRWHLVELTLFDDSLTSLTVHPKEAEFGQVIYIDGAVTMPRNGTGVQNTTVIIKINGTADITILTNKNGNFNYTYTIPYKKPGKYTVNVEFVPIEETLISSYASSYFVIIPTNTTLTLESKPDSGIFGDIITISGALLTQKRSAVPDANISISLDNRTISSVETDNNGSYTYDLQIQGIPSGVHTLKADFIPDDRPLLSSRNNLTITVIPTNTSIKISAPVTVHQENYLNFSWIVTTEKGFVLKDTGITVFLDDNEIGSAIINRGNFSYWIDKNIQKGKHNLTVKYAGASPFLPSERTNIIEILEPEFNYNILFLLLVICIIIYTFYIRKDRSLHNNIDFNKEEEKIEEMIKTEEPEPVDNVVQENEKVRENEAQEKSFPEIEELIAKGNYNRSISLSYFTIKNRISERLKIDHYQCMTHRELFDRVKNAIPLINDEMKDITEIYELAMYSGIEASKEHAVRALESVKNISYKINNEL